MDWWNENLQDKPMIFIWKSMVQILNSDDVRCSQRTKPSISCWYFPVCFYGFIEDFPKNYMIILWFSDAYPILRELYEYRDDVILHNIAYMYDRDDHSQNLHNIHICIIDLWL